jgi:hypothetical protein
MLSARKEKSNSLHHANKPPDLRYGDLRLGRHLLYVSGHALDANKKLQEDRQAIHPELISKLVEEHEERPRCERI